MVLCESHLQLLLPLLSHCRTLLCAGRLALCCGQVLSQLCRQYIL
jgi:hypothetical protein